MLDVICALVENNQLGPVLQLRERGRQVDYLVKLGSDVATSLLFRCNVVRLGLVLDTTASVGTHLLLFLGEHG